MVTVTFPPALQRHVPCAAVEVVASTVREALLAACEQWPRVRGYLLDDSGALRPHVAVFVDGAVTARSLQAPLAAKARVDVLQALSGG